MSASRDYDYGFRLTALRAELAKAGYDGFLVPMADEYQSEYVPASARRLRFLTGFTGSAGFAIVLRDKAAFFTDGRYILQAQQQVPSDLFNLQDSTLVKPADWLAKQLKTPGAKIAYDPWLHTDDAITRFKKALQKIGAELTPVVTNPIDALWPNRPAPPTAPVEAYDLAFAGQSSIEKRAAMAEKLRKNDLAAAVITDPASIAWLLNIRGGDVPNTPLPLSFAILHDTGKVSWFVHPAKLTPGLAAHLGEDITAEPPENFAYALDGLAAKDKPIRIDPNESANWVVERLRTAKAKLDLGEDPCALPKACKNPVEIQGMRNSHLRDGVALCNFLAWLEDHYASGNVTELDAEQKLAAFREANNLYRGPSFHTIAGAGEHGAIVHYRATAETNRALKSGDIFLLDSGGQYLDGTTDVTRTIALGAPSAEVRDRFTRVLKGHIALARIRFPEGTTGADLDTLARQYLWMEGLDYSHGTGHGVGSYLGVHEGPQAISRRSPVPLKPGMVVSNEPGFYKAGHYGIRIENLQAVIELGPTVEPAGHKTLGFETLTLAPIDTKLIDLSLMNAEETAWLNAYHARVYKAVSPLVEDTTCKWLRTATREI